MRVCIEYGPLKEDDHAPHKRVDKTDHALDHIAERHAAKLTGSGFDLQFDDMRELEYKIPHSELAGFFTEVTDHWKKLKLHRIIVYDK
jgi:hypothetical protein